jgi:Domain of unknown function (DUF1707)
MSNPESPPRPTASALRRANWPGSEMRIGDAERSAVADRLAKHFSDGRLDQAEFSERLDRAMRAKTMGDLTGLLHDLPEAEPMPGQVGGRRHQRKMLKVQLERERLRLQHERREQRRVQRQERWHTLRWAPLFVALLVTLIIVAHTLATSIGAWILLGLVAFLWLRHATGGRRDN